MPLSINFTPEEKTKMNKAERFVLGIYRSLDARQTQNYWLRDFAYRLFSGWYSVFTWVHRKEKSVEFIADIWDPITVYPEWQEGKLVKCIRTFETDRKTAISLAVTWQQKGLKFNFPEPQLDTVKVINYWRDDRGKIYNALQLGDTLIKPLTQEKQFKKIPIHVGAVGIPDITSSDWTTRFGENIIAANRDMYEYEDMMISLMATIMAETAYPNVITKTATGAPAIKGELKGYGEVIPIKIQEAIDLLKHAATPEEVGVLMSWAKRQIQKASFSDAVYGGMPNFEISGFALSQFLASIRYKIGPYHYVMQSKIGAIMSDLIEQYRDGDNRGDFPTVSLQTTNPQEIRKGLFFIEEFSPSDIPERTFIEVIIPITSAVDKIQQMLFARQAMSPPQLISRETLWDEMLGIQDSEQEYTRILQDEMLEMPIVKQIAMIEQLQQRISFYESQGKTAQAEALKKYVIMLETDLGMRQGISEVPGVSPSFSPPEMGATGKASPDVLRSTMGMGTPGLKRRSQTPEEREESKLVSSTGERLL
mgnify:CR=1 FL=1